MPEESTASTGKRKFTPLIIILIVVLVVSLTGGIVGGMYLVNTYAQIKDAENAQMMKPALPEEVSASQPNPIAFDALSEQNSDIYAWIYIPETSVNFPICQSANDDSFYLDHDAAKKETELGAIFTEHQFNNRDFQDRVTVVYGHNGFGDTMFTDLHKFESKEYFDAHDKFCIYVPGHIYTYEIMSAFMADDYHLMGRYNFQTETGFAEFVSNMQNPNVLGANTRNVSVSPNDKVVVLSTCNTGALESTGRYLVSGVMVDDQPTQ